MKISYPEISYEDERGIIRDILPDGAYNGITFISHKAGTWRGCHYHMHTTQWMYIISGMLSAAVVVHGIIRDPVRFDANLTPGALVKVPPGEPHAFVALEDSTYMVFCEGLRHGKEYETDTIRVDPRLFGNVRPK